MTEKEVIEIVKESNLWEPLTEGEKQAVINHVLSNSQPSLTEINRRPPPAGQPPPCAF